MKNAANKLNHRTERRSFIKNVAAGGATVGMLANGLPAFGQSGGGVTKGDLAILTFLAAVEIIESDLWLQYAELGGVQDNEIPGLPTGGSAAYTAALNNLDADMSQYIHDNTEDEFSHAAFLNAYLASKGADPVNLDEFRTLPSSKARGGCQRNRAAHEPHAAHRGYQLVDSLP